MPVFVSPCLCMCQQHGPRPSAAGRSKMNFLCSALSSRPTGNSVNMCRVCMGVCVCIPVVGNNSSTFASLPAQCQHACRYVRACVCMCSVNMRVSINPSTREGTGFPPQRHTTYCLQPLNDLQRYHPTRHTRTSELGGNGFGLGPSPRVLRV